MELTDIAPHGRPIHDVPIPHDRIDEPHERGKSSPEDKQTRASVPARGLGQVPSKRDRDRGEGEQREDGEYVINGRHFPSLREREPREKRLMNLGKEGPEMEAIRQSTVPVVSIWGGDRDTRTTSGLIQAQYLLNGREG